MTPRARQEPLRPTDPAVATAARSTATAVMLQTIVDNLRSRIDIDNEWRIGLLAEVERLRRLTSDQAATIASLRTELAAARESARRLELVDLVSAVTAAVIDGGAGLDGYAVSEATVEVRTAVEIRDGRLGAVTDPGGLLRPDSLSTVSVHLAAQPGMLGAAPVTRTG